MTIEWRYCSACGQGYYGHFGFHEGCLVSPAVVKQLEEGDLPPEIEDMPGEDHFCPVCQKNYYGEEGHHKGCSGPPSENRRV